MARPVSGMRSKGAAVGPVPPRGRRMAAPRGMPGVATVRDLLAFQTCERCNISWAWPAHPLEHCPNCRGALVMVADVPGLAR